MERCSGCTTAWPAMRRWACCCARRWARCCCALIASIASWPAGWPRAASACCVSTTTAAATAGFARLILWDPVLDGARHVAELDAGQEALRNDPQHYVRPRGVEEAAGQWLGFPVSAQWRAQLAGWRAEPARVPTLILDSRPEPVAGGWSPLAEAGARVLAMPASTDWSDLHRLEHAILAPDLLRMVGAALEPAA